MVSWQFLVTSCFEFVVWSGIVGSEVFFESHVSGISVEVVNYGVFPMVGGRWNEC